MGTGGRGPIGQRAWAGGTSRGTSGACFSVSIIIPTRLLRAREKQSPGCVTHHARNHHWSPQANGRNLLAANWVPILRSLGTSLRFWLRAEAEEEPGGEEADERGEGGGKDEGGDEAPGGEHGDEVGVEGDGAGDEAKADGEQGGKACPADAACEEEGQGDEDAEGVGDEEDEEEHGWLASPAIRCCGVRC